MVENLLRCKHGGDVANFIFAISKVSEMFMNIPGAYFFFFYLLYT